MVKYQGARGGGGKGLPTNLGFSPTNPRMEGEAWACRVLGALNGELRFPECFVSFSLILVAAKVSQGLKRVA